MKKKLLVVDDDKNMTKLLAFVLRNEYEVIPTQDPETGLKLVESLAIDGLVVDLAMPGMSGFDIIRRIRFELNLWNIPLIVLSGKESSEDRIHCLKLGADDYILKPFNPEELKVRLKNIFRRSAVAV